MSKYSYLLVSLVISGSSLVAMDLYVAAGRGDVKRVLEILREGTTAINRTYTANDETALMEAVGEGNVEIVGHLLQHPTIDIDIKAKDGKTALHCAAKKSSFAIPQGARARIVAMLLAKSKKSLNQQDIFGCTPFFHAVVNDEVEVVEAFLKQPEIDVAITNNEHCAPWEMAAKLKHCCPHLNEIVDMINRHLIKKSQSFDF